MRPWLASGSVIYYNGVVKNIAPLGPAPTASAEEPPPQALEPARRRLLQAIAERRESAHPTVGDLVAVVGGHPNTTRHHLRVLVDAGLVREEHVPPAGGRGRPASRYAVTAAGRQVASAAPRGSAAQEYVALAAAFAERLAERDGDPGADARAIGRAWGTGLAVRHADEVAGDGSGAQRVVGLLDRLGFSPEAGHDDPVGDAPGTTGTRWTGSSGPGPGRGRASGSGTTVLLRTCPLLDAARRHPEVVCQVHLGLVAGALEAHGEPSEGLGLVPFARPGACVLTLPPTLVR